MSDPARGRTGHTSLKTQGVAGSQARRGQAKGTRRQPACPTAQQRSHSVRTARSRPHRCNRCGPAERQRRRWSAARKRSTSARGQPLSIRSTGGQQNLLSTRTLNSHQEVCSDSLTNSTLKSPGRSLIAAKVSVNIGRIGNDHELLVAQAVGNQVVDHAALVIDQDRVLCLTDLQDGHVRHQSVIQNAPASGPVTRNSPMWRGRRYPHGYERLRAQQRRSSTSGHIPATEIGEGCAQLLYVNRVQEVSWGH